MKSIKIGYSMYCSIKKDGSQHVKTARKKTERSRRSHSHPIKQTVVKEDVRFIRPEHLGGFAVKN